MITIIYCCIVDYKIKGTDCYTPESVTIKLLHSGVITLCSCKTAREGPSKTSATSRLEAVVLGEPLGFIVNIVSW